MTHTRQEKLQLSNIQLSERLVSLGKWGRDVRGVLGGKGGLSWAPLMRS